MDDDLIVAGDGPRPFKCQGCPEDFEWGSQLQEHRAAQHPPPTPSPAPRQIFYCLRCPAAYFTNYDLNIHFNVVHRDASHVCPVEGCGAIFVAQPYLQSHMTTAHSIEETEVPLERYVERNHTDHVRVPDARPTYRCPHCPKMFLVKQNYKRHVNAVHLDKGHKCPVKGCRHSSLTAALLKSHLATHSKPKKFACDRCPKIYKHLGFLKKHVVNVHGGHDKENDHDEVQIIEDDEVPKQEEDDDDVQIIEEDEVQIIEEAKVPKIISVVCFSGERVNIVVT